jgi:lysophospholipase L1-like esterase
VIDPAFRVVECWHSLLDSGGLLRRVLTAAVLAATVASSVGCAPQALPPVSDKVASYYSNPPTPNLPDVPVAVFVGDSYTAGSGATTPARRWTSLVSREMDWFEENMGSPGAGYLNVGRGTGCPQGGCPSFSTLAKKVVAATETDYVVVAGGRADSGQDKEAVRGAAESFFSTVRKGLPKAKIIAKYLDVGGFFVGRPKLIGPDGVHPTDEGYREFFTSIIGKVQEAAR